MYTAGVVRSAGNHETESGNVVAMKARQDLFYLAAHAARIRAYRMRGIIFMLLYLIRYMRARYNCCIEIAHSLPRTPKSNAAIVIEHPRLAQVDRGHAAVRQLSWGNIYEC